MLATGCALRLVVPDDAEMLARFFAAHDDPDTLRHFHPFPLTTETAHKIAGYTGRDRYFIAVAAGAVIGFCMLRGWDEGFAIPSFGVLVDQRFRGHGLGCALTAHAITEAARMGAPAVRLSVYASNTSAYTLYCSLGFTEQSRRTVEIAGATDERIIMTISLDRP